MNYVGLARVRTTTIKTRNPWGDIAEVAGKLLPVIERNETGDCLCILEGKRLVDVNNIDVYAYIPNPQATLEQALRNAFKL